MTDNRWFVRSILRIGLVLIGLIPAALHAQEATVSGQVKASVGGAPLVGAIVTISSLRVSATTDNEGKYRLVLPAGSSGAVQLTVRRIGFQTGTVQVNLSSASVEQDITLAEGAIELQQVVVTALGIEREQRSLSYAAQSISGDRLSDVPTQNVVSALQGNVAGVQVTNSANPFGSARIAQRHCTARAQPTARSYTRPRAARAHRKGDSASRQPLAQTRRCRSVCPTIRTGTARASTVSSTSSTATSAA